MRRYGSMVSYSRREMEAMGEPVGMPDRGPAFGEFLDLGSILGSVAGPVLGGIFGSDASSNAADAQAASADKADELQKYMYDTTRADQAPGRALYGQATNQLANLLGFNGQAASTSALTSDPGYQFGLTQGQNGLNHQAAAAGSLYSGAQLKAASRYNSDYAGTKFGDTYNRLANAAGLGQTATSATSAAGANYANQAGQNITGAGNATASGYVGSANALNNAFGSAYNNYSQQNLMSKLFGGGTNSFGNSTSNASWNTPSTSWGFGTGGMGD